MCVFNMFRVCLHPLGRSLGGKIPLRRLSKNERKLMKQVKQLRKRCSPGREQFYLDTIKDLQRQLNNLDEIFADTLKARDDFADRLNDALDRLNGAREFYSDKISFLLRKCETLRFSKRRMQRMRNQTIAQSHLAGQTIARQEQLLATFMAILEHDGYSVAQAASGTTVLADAALLAAHNGAASKD